MKLAANVKYAFGKAAEALERLEDVFGPNYNLTLVARCTRTDLDDADMVVTADDLGEVQKTVERRRAAEGS